MKNRLSYDSGVISQAKQIPRVSGKETTDPAWLRNYFTAGRKIA